jgi:hypothetical protein
MTPRAKVMKCCTHCERFFMTTLPHSECWRCRGQRVQHDRKVAARQRLAEARV